MKIMCSRCDKEVENTSPYNFYVLHKECLRDHVEKVIDEFLERWRWLRALLIPAEQEKELNIKPLIIFINKEIEKWEAKKSED